MRLTSDDLKPIWDNAIARTLGPAPLGVVAAAARFAGDRVTNVHAEAAPTDNGTAWRLLWLAGDHLGIVDANGDVSDWNGYGHREPKESKISATIRPIADIRRVVYQQAGIYRDDFAQGEYEVRGSLCVHFHDDEILLGDREWKHVDQDSLDTFVTAVVERWSSLRAQ